MNLLERQEFELVDETVMSNFCQQNLCQVLLILKATFDRFNIGSQRLSAPLDDIPQQIDLGIKDAKANH